MDEIVTERSGSILRVELNRPAKRNAMTSRMYITLASIFGDAIGFSGEADEHRLALPCGLPQAPEVGEDVGVRL